MNLKFIPLLCLCFITFTASANDPVAMPMMAEPEVEQDNKPASNFTQIYRQAGQPKITFLINERLGNNAGQWEASQRLHISSNAQYKGMKKGKKNQGSEAAELILAVENRIPSKAQDVNNEWISFLLSGFFTRIQDLNIKVVDNKTIFEIEKAASVSKNDKTKNLMLSAIRSYSDLFTEIYIFEKGRNIYAAQLRVIDINSGNLLAQTTTVLDGVPDKESHYKATSKGYVKTETIPACKEQTSIECEQMSNPNIVRGYQLAEVFAHYLAKGLKLK